MSGILRKLMTLWCVTCGLIVPPAVLGVVLAQSMGILDLHPLVARLQGSSEGVADADDPGIDPLADLEADEPIPSEAFSWRRQLKELDRRVATENEALAAREIALAARESAQEKVASSLAEFLADIFEVPVSTDSVIEEPERWGERLASRTDADAQRPRLIKMIQTVENDALAQILATPDASNGIDEVTVTRLMDELPPKRAGEVITELGRRDPALAARILARLEKSTGLMLNGGDSE